MLKNISGIPNDSDELDGKHGSEYSDLNHASRHSASGLDPITPESINSVRKHSFAFYAHYCSGVILLVPYAGSEIGWGESMLLGTLAFRRGDSAASNRTELIDISVKTSYSNTDYSMTKSCYSWNWKFCTVMYEGKPWLAIQSGDNIQDARIDFWGLRSFNGASPLGTYTDRQFGFIPYFRTGDPSNTNGVLNAEVNNSLSILNDKFELMIGS